MRLDTAPLITAGFPAFPYCARRTVRRSDSKGHSRIRRTPVRSNHRLSASPVTHAYLPFIIVVRKIWFIILLQDLAVNY